MYLSLSECSPLTCPARVTLPVATLPPAWLSGSLHHASLLEVDAETKESTRKTEVKLDGRYKEGHERKKLNEGQWEERKQWSLVSDNVENRFETCKS